MIAHLFAIDAGRGAYRFSGYNACGDGHDGAGERASQGGKPRPPDAAVEVGAEFHLTEEGHLYVLGGHPAQFTTWSADRLVLAARMGWFGFKLLPKETT